MTISYPDRDSERVQQSSDSALAEQQEDQVRLEEGASEGEGEAEQQPLPPVDTSNTCLICKKQDAYIEFAAWPCGCPSMCRSCAQKLCTGGKCRVCHEMFPEIKRCRLSSSR